MANRVLGYWQRYKGTGWGRWLFGFMVCRQAPYFSTIQPRFEELDVGRARVSMQKRRAVENHIRSVHAIALCNLAELAAGTMTEVSLPPSMRWLPKGMNVRYLKRATTAVTANATLGAVVEGAAQDVVATVEITDQHGVLVCAAEITMYVSPRSKAA